MFAAIGPRTIRPSNRGAGVNGEPLWAGQLDGGLGRLPSVPVVPRLEPTSPGLLDLDNRGLYAPQLLQLRHHVHPVALAGAHGDDRGEDQEGQALASIAPMEQRTQEGKEA